MELGSAELGHHAVENGMAEREVEALVEEGQPFGCGDMRLVVRSDARVPGAPAYVVDAPRREVDRRDVGALAREP